MIKRYTFGAFIRDRIIEYLIALCASLLVIGAMAILGVNAEAVVLVCILIVISFVAIIFTGYFRATRFVNGVVSALNASGQGRLAMALVEEPAHGLDLVIYDLLSNLSDSYVKELMQAKDDAASYKEYVELWIHEIKTPIAAAKLILEGSHGPEASHLKLELERIESSVEQALYYARSLNLTNDYIIHEVDLVKCIKDACKKNSRYLIERHCTPEIRLDSERTVFADEPWLNFILSQIIVNAATYGSTKIVFTSIVVDEDTPNGRIVLEVRDNGRGIAAEDVPRVFDRGFTGKNGRNSGNSTGMGLYLVALMCARMDIGVEIASEEGKGTGVLLSFPHDRRRIDLQRGA